MRLLRRLLVYASLFAALLILVAAVVYVIFGRDIPPPADGDLLPVFREVAAKDNGFHDVRFSAEELSGAEEADELWELFIRGRDLDPGTGVLPEASAADDYEPMLVEGWDEELARKIVADNAEHLRRLDECLARADFVVERGEDPLDPDLDHVKTWRGLTDIERLKIALLIRDGKSGAALDECRKLLRFGRRIQEAQGWLIHALIGSAWLARGLEATRELLERSELDAAALRRLGDELRDYEMTPALLEDIIRTEYFWASSVIDAVLEQPEVQESWLGRRIAGFTFKPQRTKQLVASAFRTLLEDRRKPPSQWKPLPEPKLDLFNVRGTEVYSMLAPRTWGPIDARIVRGQDFLMRAHRLLLALRCCEMEHGSLPESLDELVPAQIDAVPADPYDERPLRYSRERRIVYSVGSDLEDGGGSPEEPPANALSDEEEPTLRLPSWKSARAQKASR